MKVRRTFNLAVKHCDGASDYGSQKARHCRDFHYCPNGDAGKLFEDVTKRFLSNNNQKVIHKDAWLRALTIVLYCLGAVIAALAEPEHPFVVIWIPIVIIIGIIAVAGTRFHGKSEG